MRDGDGTIVELDALGSGTLPAHGADGLECFVCPASVRAIELTSAELICSCPVTGQPDLYHVSIRYGPNPERPRALETKSVKLWLWSYQQREGVFAEALAAEIAHEVYVSAAAPAWVDVALTQNVRGGIVTSVQAIEGEPPG